MNEAALAGKGAISRCRLPCYSVAHPARNCQAAQSPGGCLCTCQESIPGQVCSLGGKGRQGRHEDKKRRAHKCAFWRDAILTRQVSETAQEVVETCDVTFALETQCVATSAAQLL